jgi:deoxycytidylate deaminase
MNKYLKLAHKLTKKSTAKHHRMCCVVVVANSVKSIGFNRLYDHAEKRALRPHEDYKGGHAFIARGNGKTSKPCPECRKIIIQAGIRRATYISVDGIETTETYETR